MAAIITIHQITFPTTTRKRKRAKNYRNNQTDKLMSKESVNVTENRTLTYCWNRHSTLRHDFFLWRQVHIYCGERGEISHKLWTRRAAVTVLYTVPAVSWHTLKSFSSSIHLNNEQVGIRRDTWQDVMKYCFKPKHFNNCFAKALCI